MVAGGMVWIEKVLPVAILAALSFKNFYLARFFDEPTSCKTPNRMRVGLRLRVGVLLTWGKFEAAPSSSYVLSSIPVLDEDS